MTRPGAGDYFAGPFGSVAILSAPPGGAPGAGGFAGLILGGGDPGPVMTSKSLLMLLLLREKPLGKTDFAVA
jgi:hypothetical protein